MTKGMVYKLIFIIFLVVFSVVLILPTIGEKEMRVDLVDDITAEQTSIVKKRFAGKEYAITEKGHSLLIAGRNITNAVMNEVRIFGGVKDAVILKHWTEEVFLAKKINLGLDLQGGMRLVLRANFEKIEEKTKEKLSEKDKSDITQQALELIRNRVDRFGVSEPSIRPRGNEAIEIQLPGIKDPKGVKQMIGTTGRVEYRLVDDTYSQIVGDWFRKTFKDQKLKWENESDALVLEKIIKDGAIEAKLPDNLEILFFFDRDKTTKKIFPGYPMVLEKKVALAGDDIKKAWVGRDEYGGLAVNFQTTADGATKFADVTSPKNKDKKLAIIIDDKVRSAPAINVQITTGQALITGNFTMEEVETLTRIIKEGALPVDLKIVEERTVGPSLGQDAIEAGINSAIVGFVGIVLFMILYYKVGGIISAIGLLLNMIFMLAILSLLGFTLTLPGIAGFVLTMGMAVDSNVIIYERIKEELAAGKSVRMAITYGFDRAFWTIFDSNVTTIIGALMLSQYEIGPVKGFAVTLIIGIITTMFVALFITRYVYELISLNKKLNTLSI